MVSAFVAIFGVLAILVVSEILWRRKLIRGEVARKFTHIIIGCYVAAWPWMLTWREIQAITLLLLVVVLISKHYKIFHAIYAVKRKTVGEVCYALGIFGAAVISTQRWQFAAAILVMTLADGLAALFGRRFGGKTRYLVAGEYKSIVGSTVFFIVAFLTLEAVSYGLLGDVERSLLVAASFPFAAILTGVEALSIHGTDNLTVPLAFIVLARLIIL